MSEFQTHSYEDPNSPSPAEIIRRLEAPEPEFVIRDGVQVPAKAVYEEHKISEDFFHVAEYVVWDGTEWVERRDIIADWID